MNISTPTPETSTGTGGPCPEGHFCPEQTEDPYPCANTTFRNTTMGESSADCYSCTPGYFCGTEGLSEPTGPCSPGFFCLWGNNIPNPTGKILFKFMSELRLAEERFSYYFFWCLWRWMHKLCVKCSGLVLI